LKKNYSDSNKESRLKWLKDINFKRTLWFVLFYVVAVAVLGIGLLTSGAQLEVNQPSPRKFEANRTIVFESNILTEQAREQAVREVEPILKVDRVAVTEMEAQIKNYFQQIAHLRNDPTMDETEKIKGITEKVGLDVSGDVARSLLEADEDIFDYLQRQSVQLMRRYMEQGVQAEALATVKENMLSEVELLSIDRNFQESMKIILEAITLKETLVYDSEATAQKRQEARAEVAPVQVTIKKNEKIADTGDILTPTKIEALQHLGLLRAETAYTNFLGLALVVLVTYALIIVFINHYRKEYIKDEKYMVLLGLLLTIGIILTRILAGFDGTTETTTSLGYLVPVAAITMLIAILLDSRLAIFIAVILGLYNGIVNGNELQFAVFSIVGGVTGVYSVTHLAERGDLMRASLYIMFANVVTVLALGLMIGFSLTKLSIVVIFGIANGLISSVVTIGTLPFLETVFGLTTSSKLLELSNPNQPILRRLLMEAPGTYHHSIIVGNLAEGAADAVGANSLLARVGAYYHDIGKIKRPYFFIENQINTNENPHDKLAPTLSTLIITAHVKDGLELAKEHKLPKVIADIIAQHHGTSLISFFYHKAAENEKAENLNKADFSYEGPKPRSKEAAIVMLADAVEAGARSLKNPTPSRMEAFVRKVVKDKLEEGQLEESDLTFRELDTIIQAFLRVLNGIFHSRIEYPDQVLKEIERRKTKDGALRKQ
jgi:putative nucleotidyltransferase with HDIG domain